MQTGPFQRTRAFLPCQAISEPDERSDAKYDTLGHQASAPDHPADPDFLTTAQVARLFKFAPQTITKMIRRGDFPAVRIGGRWRIPRQAIEDYLRRHTEGIR
ncbi:MAG TPA: helix-turn-helix domain-containing protein [Alphaproteobacteria bacterium]|nr:helix-turn-helix domain-containing protein [Alphaproteobacteria bacterium]